MSGPKLVCVIRAIFFCIKRYTVSYSWYHKGSRKHIQDITSYPTFNFFGSWPINAYNDWIIVDLDNGLSHFWHHAIIQTNMGIYCSNRLHGRCHFGSKTVVWLFASHTFRIKEQWHLFTEFRPIHADHIKPGGVLLHPVRVIFSVMVRQWHCARATNVT